MPLPLLAFFGLGLGGKVLADRYTQNQQAQQQGLMNRRAQALTGRSGQELAGPTRGGGPLMSPGTGLMGGEIAPLQYAQQLMQLGGPYAQAGQNIMQSLLKPQAPRASQATGPMKDAVAIGLKPGSPEYAQYIRERTMKPTSEINIHPQTAQMPRLLTDAENEAYNRPPGTVLTGRGEIKSPPPSRTSAGEAKQFGQGEIAMQMLGELTEQLDAGTLDPSDPKTWIRSEASTVPILSKFIELTPDEAKSKSNITQLENLVLAMMRGAAVGPEEQAIFKKQLPQLGQDNALFAENLANTKRNIMGMMQIMSDLRGLGHEVASEPDIISTRVMGGVTWEQIGEDPNLKSSWRRAD